MVWAIMGVCSSTLLSPPPQHAGGEALGQLQHGRLGLLGGGAGEGHLLVDLLGKDHNLRAAGKGVPGQRPQFRYKGRCLRIGAPGAHGGVINHLVEFRRGLEPIVHPIQPGGGSNDAVRQIYDTPDRCNPA